MLHFLSLKDNQLWTIDSILFSLIWDKWSLNYEKHFVKNLDQRKYSIFEKFLWNQASLKSGWWAKLKEPAFYLSRAYLSRTRHTQQENEAFKFLLRFFPERNFYSLGAIRPVWTPFPKEIEDFGFSRPKIKGKSPF